MPTKEKLRARQATLKAKRHELDLQIADLQKAIDAPAAVVKKRPVPKAPSKKKTASPPRKRVAAARAVPQKPTKQA